MPKYQKICKKCSYKDEGYVDKYDYIVHEVVMLRLYIRIYSQKTPQTKPTSYKAKWYAIGWICPWCKQIIHDNIDISNVGVVKGVIKLTPEGKVKAEKRAKKRAVEAEWRKKHWKPRH